MAKNLPISFSFTLITLLLCLQAKTDSSSEAYSLRILNQKTSSGIVDIKKDSSSSNGFYVEANLVDLNTGNSDTVKMMISIPNVDTMVAESCLNFNKYDCDKYHCKQETSGPTIDFPSFTATSLFIGAPLYLDYDYWNITSSLSFAQSCNTQDDTSSIGSNRYGVLGLGTGKQSGFTLTQVFSIYLESDLSKGKLVFKNDASNYAKSSQPVYTLNNANTTWQVPFTRAYISLPKYSVALDNCNIVFDINSDTIGLPFDAYESFIKYFIMTPGIKCGSGPRPTCSYTGKIQDLPDLTLELGDDMNVNIPPKIYATVISDGENESSFYLNFRGTTPELIGKNYVTPTFENSVILGAHFMSYYYSVFDFTSGKNVISLFVARTPDKNNNPDTALWIAVGAAVLIGLAALCYHFANKKKNVGAERDDPLIENQQDAPVFNYPGYQQQK